LTLDEFITQNSILISSLFQGDMERARRWLSKPNLNFGGSSPRDVIEKGSDRKVRFWLEQILGGN